MQFRLNGFQTADPDRATPAPAPPPTAMARGRGEGRFPEEVDVLIVGEPLYSCSVKPVEITPSIKAPDLPLASSESALFDLRRARYQDLCTGLIQGSRFHSAPVIRLAIYSPALRECSPGHDLHLAIPQTPVDRIDRGELRRHRHLALTRSPKSNSPRGRRTRAQRRVITITIAYP